ncbi:MAG: adenylate/guanylate cyclase domain-containing protein [Roseiflexaceae bacterium]
MAELPTGIVTFVFTDIEGSTRLWEQRSQAMPTALARHDAIVRGAIENHDGVVFRTGGDAFYAAFGCAPAALAAALAAQLALAAEPWSALGLPDGELLRVRMALHTSEVVLRDGDYIGPPLNRIARLLIAGHGGQTLLSLATAELVRAQLPDGAALRDLGEHRLRDLAQPEQIYQLDAPGLLDDFPPLRTHGKQGDARNILQSQPPAGEDQSAAEQPAWQQVKLPDMPGIDYDAVFERDRQQNRRRSGRKKKTESGGLL